MTAGRSRINNVSTHSRLKAAGYRPMRPRYHRQVSTHSRLKAAGKKVEVSNSEVIVSTHSRLKAAGTAQNVCKLLPMMFQHTAA